VKRPDYREWGEGSQPQPQPQPRLPAAGQAGLVRQLSQALEAAFGMCAAKDENPLRNLPPPHFGQALAASRRLRARWSKVCPHALQVYS